MVSPHPCSSGWKTMPRTVARAVGQTLAVGIALAFLSSPTPGGIIAAWQFEGNVNDATNTYNATAFNSPTYATGVIGQAISLNGSNQYASVGAMGTYANATVSVWIKSVNISSPGSQAIFHSSTYANGTPHFLLEYPGGSSTATGVVIDVKTGEIKVNGGRSFVSQGTWYNLAYTYDKAASSLRLYSNGSEIGSATISNTVDLNLNNMFIGSGYSRPFNGLLDDLGVWNETLTAAKVKGINSFATSTLNYGQTNVALLYGLTAGQSTTTSDGRVWEYQTGLTGTPGDLQTLGSGVYAMNLGGGTGVQTISPVPEIDPAGMGSVLALVAGAVGCLERRRPKVT